MLGNVLSEIFKSEMKNSGMTLAKLAELTGKGVSTLSEKLNEKRPMNTSDIDSIAGALNIKLDVKKKDDLLLILWSVDHLVS